MSSHCNLRKASSTYHWSSFLLLLLHNCSLFTVTSQGSVTFHYRFLTFLLAEADKHKSNLTTCIKDSLFARLLQLTSGFPPGFPAWGSPRHICREVNCVKNVEWMNEFSLVWRVRNFCHPWTLEHLYQVDSGNKWWEIKWIFQEHFPKIKEMTNKQSDKTCYQQRQPFSDGCTSSNAKLL